MRVLLSELCADGVYANLASRITHYVAVRDESALFQKGK